MKARRSLLAPSALMLGCLLATACVPTTETPTQSLSFIKSHALAGGDILAKAPGNYCVDSTTRATKNFVMMVNCDVLTAQATTAPNARGILTVSTSPLLPKSTQSIDLASSLGEGSTQSRRVPGLVLRKMTDQSTGRLPGAAATHWRGLMRFNRRIVSFAIYGPEGGSVLGSRGKRLLEDLANQTATASQGGTPAQ